MFLNWQYWCTNSKLTLPETNSSHLKMDGWKMSFLFRWPIFRCVLVGFRECTHMAPLEDTKGPFTNSSVWEYFSFVSACVQVRLLVASGIPSATIRSSRPWYPSLTWTRTLRLHYRYNFLGNQKVIHMSKNFPTYPWNIPKQPPFPTLYASEFLQHLGVKGETFRVCDPHGYVGVLLEHVFFFVETLKTHDSHVFQFGLRESYANRWF